MLTEKQVQQVLESYGLEVILQDHETTLEYLLLILDELGYLDIERYVDEKLYE